MANIERYQSSLDRYRRQEPILPTVPMHPVQPQPSQMMEMLQQHQVMQLQRLKLQEQQQALQMMELIQRAEESSMIQLQQQQYAPMQRYAPAQQEVEQEEVQQSFSFNSLLWGFVAAFALLAVCLATENSRNGVGYQPVQQAEGGH